MPANPDIISVRLRPVRAGGSAREPARGGTVRRRLALGTLLLILAALVSACGSATAPAGTAHSGPLQEGSTDVGGVTRTYRVYVPPSTSTSRPVPLLLALHGGEEQAAAMEDRSQFDTYAASNGAIVVYPNGHGPTWNAGSCCGFPDVSTSNEVAFIDALITRVEGEHTVDTSRVYVTGVSAGAAMAYTLACQLSGRIVAMASLAGTMDLATCHPQRPVSILEVHGTADGEVAYEGGRTRSGNLAPSSPAIVTAWASLDACPAATTTQTTGPEQVMQWTGCREGTAVTLETIQGGHHVWFAPGLGPVDGSLDASHVIWEFLNKQRRPG